MTDILYAAHALGFKSSEMINGVFLVDGKPPTPSQLSEIESKADELEAEYNSLEWSRNRQKEYAKKSAVQQIEMMADGTFSDWYSGIKAANPKG
jgi:hypothetical protein